MTARNVAAHSIPFPLFGYSLRDGTNIEGGATVENRNCELSANELAQGVGGVYGRRMTDIEIEERAKKELRSWKKAGKMKEDYLAEYSWDAFRTRMANLLWDSV